MLIGGLTEAHSSYADRVAEPGLCGSLNESLFEKPLAHYDFWVAPCAIDFVIQLAHFVGGNGAGEF
jgi:hypothetical protein